MYLIVLPDVDSWREIWRVMGLGGVVFNVVPVLVVFVFVPLLTPSRCGSGMACIFGKG